jgi:hypothetical protein
MNDGQKLALDQYVDMRDSGMLHILAPNDPRRSWYTCAKCNYLVRDVSQHTEDICIVRKIMQS